VTQFRGWMTSTSCRGRGRDLDLGPFGGTTTVEAEVGTVWALGAWRGGGFRGRGEMSSGSSRGSRGFGPGRADGGRGGRGARRCRRRSRGRSTGLAGSKGDGAEWGLPQPSEATRHFSGSRAFSPLRLGGCWWHGDHKASGQARVAKHCSVAGDCVTARAAEQYFS